MISASLSQTTTVTFLYLSILYYSVFKGQKLNDSLGEIPPSFINLKSFVGLPGFP